MHMHVPGSELQAVVEARELFHRQLTVGSPLVRLLDQILHCLGAALHLDQEG